MKTESRLTAKCRSIKIYGLLILLVAFNSCIWNYNKVEIETDAEFMLPFISATYTLVDLFYDFEDTVIVEQGQFFEIVDTITFSDTIQNINFETLELVFQSINYVPFQVDIKLQTFNAVTNENGSVNNVLTIVESANIIEQLNIAMPVYSVSTMPVDELIISDLQNANAIILECYFIWPHNKVSIPVLPELLAFDIDILLKFKL